MKRVLHLVGGLARGGIETWLMHVLRTIDRDQYPMDFLVWSPVPQEYDEEALALGARIFRGPHVHKPRAYGEFLKKVLRDYGPYDVVHSHLHHSSGYALRVAAQCGIPVRIAHSHNDRSAEYASAPLAKRVYLALMRRWVSRFATVGLGCSGVAAASLFGDNWQDEPRWRVLYYGVDLSPYCAPRDTQVRSELGIPENGLVVGHVGRFFEQKNHTFLLDIAEELVRQKPETRILLVGDGPLRAAMEEKAGRLGLQEKVIFAGLRPDIPRLLRSAMDVFLMPSHFEGLPMALIEAQAAGLPCTISDAISDESDIVPALMHRNALSQPASAWAGQVLKSQKRAVSAEEAWKILEQSPFNICRSVASLEEIYRV
jgi:glycosyltransferase involved in cell wall biosynthesis